MRSCACSSRSIVQICNLTYRLFSTSSVFLQVEQQSHIGEGGVGGSSSRDIEGNKEYSSLSSKQETKDSEESKPTRSPEQVREDIIESILSHDKEIFELKRLHELSMLRVEQNQRRLLKNQEDRAMYFEQNHNVETFDTVSVALHTERSTLFHTMAVERLRNVKCMLTLWTTFVTCAYLYYKYIINPEYMYVKPALKLVGSQRQFARDIKWEQMTPEEQLAELSKPFKNRSSVV